MATGDTRRDGPPGGLRVTEKRLGYTEQFFHRVHEEFSGGSAVLCASARIAGPLDVKLVKQSCGHLWERHPALRARISSREDGAYFVFDVPFNRIPIHSIFELGKTDVLKFVEREIDSGFDSKRHLWKVLLITDKVKLDKHYMIVCVHRSISDPVCAVNLVKDIIACCSRILSGKTPDVVQLPLCQNFEEIAASIPDSLFSEKKTNRTDRQADRMAFHESAPANKRYTRIRSHTVTPARLKELKALCSSERTTMQATLAAACAMAAKKQFKNNVQVQIETPQSIRKLGTIKIGDDEMRSLAYDVHTGSGAITSRTGFWKFARDFEAALLSSVPEEYRQADLGQVMEDFGSSQGFPFSCSLVYASEIDEARTSPLVIENVLITGGCRLADRLMSISAVPVRGGLSITLAYASPLLAETWVDKFVRYFINIVDKIIK